MKTMRAPAEAPSFNELSGLYGEQYLNEWAGLQMCPSCGGDGGGETLPTGPHDTGRWVDCQQCGGTGGIDSEPAGPEHTEQGD